jgi:hypothetical protein
MARSRCTSASRASSAACDWSEVCRDGAGPREFEAEPARLSEGALGRVVLVRRHGGSVTRTVLPALGNRVLSGCRRVSSSGALWSTAVRPEPHEERAEERACSTPGSELRMRPPARTRSRLDRSLRQGKPARRNCGRTASRSANSFPTATRLTHHIPFLATVASASAGFQKVPLGCHSDRRLSGRGLGSCPWRGKTAVAPASSPRELPRGQKPQGSPSTCQTTRRTIHTTWMTTM